MRNKREEVKQAVYAGMSIFYVLKNSIVKIGDENISLEDKKYLSLYLGIINSHNKIAYELRYLFSELQMNYEYLDNSIYMELYLEYFIEIIETIDFESIDNSFKYLLEKEIVKKVNIDSLVYNENNSNKKLIKK